MHGRVHMKRTLLLMRPTRIFRQTLAISPDKALACACTWVRRNVQGSAWVWRRGINVAKRHPRTLAKLLAETCDSFVR